MAQRRPDLFQWNRKTDPLSIHRQKKNNIKDWIKRVQDASDEAAQDAFGSNILEHDSLKQIIPDDEAVYEAQELLDGWLKEKTFPDLDKELDYKNENWSSSTGLILDVDSHLHSDHNDDKDFTKLYNNYFSENTADIYSPIDNLTRKGHSCQSEDLLSFRDVEDNDDIDEALLVQDVLHGMLMKDVAKNIDLGMKPLAKTAKNPLPKMNVRHEQVKQKGVRRKKAHAAKKEEMLSREEIEQKARNRIVLEERQRIQMERLEEKVILSEMEKIKLELAEERRKQEEKEQRKKKILEEAKLQMQLELRKQKENEMREKKEKEEARIQLEKEIERQSIQEMRQRMQILHKYFSAWYNVVLERRVNMGKAQATADWKCKLRAWNAWKAYVSCVKSSQEARAIEQAVKEKYRKEQMAIHHNNKQLLQQCFSSWMKYTLHKAKKKQLLLEHEEKAKKMALFLEAASTGELWKKQDPEELKKTKNLINSGVDLSETPDEEEKHKKIKRTEIIKQQAPQKKSLNKIVHSDTTYDSSSKQTVGIVKNNEKKCMCMADNSKSKDNATEDMASVKSYKFSNNSKHNGHDHNASEIEIKDATDMDDVNGISPEVSTLSSSRTKSHSEKHRRIGSEIGKKGTTDMDDVNGVSSGVATFVSTKSRVQSGKQTTKPLHLAMEERQKQRQDRKAAMDDERKKREQERLRELQAKEAERLQQELFEKEEKLRQKRKEKMLQAQKQKEKELRLEQVRLKNEIADDYYNKMLLRKYGFEPLTRLVKISKLNLQISDKYRSSLLMRICFAEWHDYARDISLEKRAKADHCYKQILLRRTFQSWLKCRFHLQNMNKIARKYSLNRILKRAFHAWQDYVTDERILMWAKESTAEEHNTMRMIKNSLKAWVLFVKLRKEERKRELRKDEYRRKVQSWLPDYMGETHSISP